MNKLPNKTSFAKGCSPWNKGLSKTADPRMVYDRPTTFKKGASVSPLTQFKKGEMSERQAGSNNSGWKGGKPKCVVCAKQLTGYKQTKCKPCTSGSNHPLWKGGKPKCQQQGCDAPLSVYTATYCRQHCVLQERNANWQGGLTSVSERLRKTSAYAIWRTHVFTRDDYTCQSCGERGGRLHADHELPFALFPELRLEILNGRTLCVPCHKLTPTFLNPKQSKSIHMMQ